jgi:hypothetical protein
MAKPIEDTNNSAAFRAALDVPTNAELAAVAQAGAAKYTKPAGGIPAEDLNADPAGRVLLTATSAAERKAAIGLDQVNNTSDANKPVSTAQALAIAAKMDKTLPALQAVYDSGTALEKAEFQSAVSGDVVTVASSRALTAADDGDRLHCTAGITLTVPAGLGAKFGCAVYGSVTLSAGAGVTLAEQRVSGATNPICAIEPTPTPNQYLLIGGAA